MQGCADQKICQKAQPVGKRRVGTAHEIKSVPDLIVFPVGLAYPETEGADLFFSQTQPVVQPDSIGHPAAEAGFLQPPAQIPVCQIQEQLFVPEAHGLQGAVAAQQGRGDGAGDGEAVFTRGPMMPGKNGTQAAGVLSGGFKSPETAQKALYMAVPDPGILVEENDEFIIGPAEAGVGEDPVEGPADAQILAEVEIAGIGDIFEETAGSG